ncbi:MAG: hypothetical protein WAN76_14185 [Candidatus Sulfotelmatobacter sp.]|jgi:hypothetical protein
MRVRQFNIHELTPNDYDNSVMQGKFRRQEREADLSVHAPEARCNASKVGRNDPCSCASGEKVQEVLRTRDAELK